MYKLRVQSIESVYTRTNLINFLNKYFITDEIKKKYYANYYMKAIIGETIVTYIDKTKLLGIIIDKN